MGFLRGFRRSVCDKDSIIGSESKTQLSLNSTQLNRELRMQVSDTSKSAS